MEDNSCAQFADVSVYEGEEHVADLLAPEVGGIGREADTDCSVPGRLRGRQDVYRELGAEPYILQSKLFSVVFRFFFGFLLGKFFSSILFAAIRDG